MKDILDEITHIKKFILPIKYQRKIYLNFMLINYKTHHKI